MNYKERSKLKKLTKDELINKVEELDDGTRIQAVHLTQVFKALGGDSSEVSHDMSYIFKEIKHLKKVSESKVATDKEEDLINLEGVVNVLIKRVQALESRGNIIEVVADEVEEKEAVMDLNYFIHKKGVLYKQNSYGDIITTESIDLEQEEFPDLHGEDGNVWDLNDCSLITPQWIEIGQEVNKLDNLKIKGCFTIESPNGHMSTHESIEEMQDHVFEDVIIKRICILEPQDSE
jgi:hypothetical protein